MKPTFSPIDLTELADEGVLLAANERFFWPLGLALAWARDDATAGAASGLHIREWRFEDGHRESIGSDEDDPIYADRRTRWQAWAAARVELFPPGPEHDRAALVDGIVPSFLGPTPTAGVEADA